MTEPFASPVIVLAGARDEAAARWCAERRELGVLRMTPEDLSRPRWTLRPADVDASTIVAEGRMVGSGAVTAVITRLARVEPIDLPHIAAEDREYVGAEMTALLLAWLALVRCPVFNRPTPQCLAGPAWRAERWHRTAHRLGIPTRPIARAAALPTTAPETPTGRPPSRGVGAVGGGPHPGAESGPEPGSGIDIGTVTVVGDRVLGARDVAEADAALSIARAADAELLSVVFERTDTGSRFAGAHPWPDPADAAVGAALEALVRGAAGSTDARRNIA
jgi:hypothetical protein